nr:iron-containing alcohol dehydrogenase [Desulfobulbaceae bacterium]
MYNFVLENPTKIIFGQDTIKQIGPEVSLFGKNVLLVYGSGSIVRNGIYDRVTASLGDACLHVTELNGIRSNPLLSDVRRGIDLAKNHSVDVVLAVGGGSVIDSAKAIAAGAVVDHNVWQFFRGKKGITNPLPVCTVLTLAASGSEMNGGMVITNEQTSAKLGTGNKKLCPKVSILDPTATFSVPANYTAYGAVDAIAHCLEFYFNAQLVNSPVQDRFIEGLIINIIEACNTLMLEPDNYEARANIMWCATMALNGWTAAGLGMVGFPMHMIEHSLSAYYDIAHGAGLSIIIPAWMRWAQNSHTKKLAQFAERVFQIHTGTSGSKAATGIERLTDWFATVHCPIKLSHCSIDTNDITKLTEHSLIQAKIWRLKEYNPEIIEEILSLAS